MDLHQAGARGFEGEGLLDAGNEIRIRVPTVGHVVGIVAPFAEIHRCAFEAARRRARDTAVFLDEVTKAALCIEGGLFAFFFVGHIDEEFDEAAIIAFGDVVVEGVHGDTPFADDDLVELGVVYIAGEAGVVPEDETTWPLIGDVVEVDHAVEVVTTGGGATGFGDIYKPVAVDEGMLCTVGLDLSQLLFGGSILAHAAAVASIGVYDGGVGKGGGRREVGQFTISDLRFMIYDWRIEDWRIGGVEIGEVISKQ